MRFDTFRSRLLVPAALVAAGVLAGCENLDRFMAVENPGQIGEREIDDPGLIPALVNTAVGQFQVMYSDLAFAGAIFSDEAVNGHNFSQWRDFDLRIVEPSNSILNSDIYSPLQRARAAGEDHAARIRDLRGEAAERDLGLARVLGYAGYSHVLLGEYFCHSPVRPDEAALESEQILERAIAYFDDAIQVATAFRAAMPAQAARADSVIHLAGVGAARAHLWLGNRAQAVEYASQVPANYQFWVAYAPTSAHPNNRLHAATTGANRYLGVGPAFRDLDDPRVRHTASPVKGHNGLTDLWTPFQPPSFSEHSPTAGAPFELGTNIRLASGLEARYIVAEAEGLNTANLAFINERRAAGNQMPRLGLGEAEFMAELRDQRRRDFFLDGHRVGDLRRYLRLYQIDQFPSGPHPNADWGHYGTATCFIPHNNERIGNPNYNP